MPAAIVTGSDSGIGKATAVALAEAGFDNGITWHSDEAGAKGTAEEVTALNRRAEVRRLDLTDLPAAAEVVDDLAGALGGLDVFVNNAGIAHNVAAEEMTDEEWRRMLSINLDGVFWCCREAGRAMLERGSGSIVNIASMSGIVSNHPQPQAHYNAAKAGVIMLTKSLAGEWASRGVRVNSISPGYVRTPITELGMSNEEWSSVWLSSTPMGRLAEPREIAPAVVYLASDASSYATGTNLVVDGGYTSW